MNPKSTASLAKKASPKKSTSLKKSAKPTALLAKFPHLHDAYDQDLKDEAFAFAEEYKTFLQLSKTERDAVKISIEAAEELGFKPLRSLKKLKAGDRVYHSIKGKGILLAVIGTEGSAKGFRILGAHIDSPRLDLKPLPMQEDNELVYFKTHYYGGVKKYQWASIPLALHGVAYREDGTRVDFQLGEGENDPKFIISDLLPHLGREQMAKNAREIIPGEALNLLIGASPAKTEEGARFKQAALDYLFEQYGLKERDLCSAELTAVPATQPFDVGFDRMLIAGYGHDDKVCAYPALQAIFNVNKPRYTSVCLLTDKEEIGSDGNTGAKSRLYENTLAEICAKEDPKFSFFDFQATLENTCMLSADVTNAFDPNFASVSDRSNSNFLAHGISLAKYTGSGGKGSASDASAEFLSSVTRLFDQNKIYWQTGEMGKIDMGGGGTIAKYFAETGMEVLDCGVAVFSMHAPIELCHKYDLYETYRAYLCFIEKFEL